MTNLATIAGINIGFRAGRPSVGPDVSVAQWKARRLGELAYVTTFRTSPRRIQYWMLDGVLRRSDEGRADIELRYDLTFMADRILGWERPKSIGHVHAGVADGGLGFAEVCEVLQGTAGFMIQDLRPGPTSTFAALVVVRRGERVVLPPLLHHATFHLEGEPLVFSDVISTHVTADYTLMNNAGGTAYLLDVTGNPCPNPAYRSVPPLIRLTAAEWSPPERTGRPLYADYLEGAEALDWVKDPEMIPSRFPELWLRLGKTITSVVATQGV